MENILREVDPIVTVPYGDWSLWSGQPWLNQVFHFCPLMETWLAGFRSRTGGIYDPWRDSNYETGTEYLGGRVV